MSDTQTTPRSRQAWNSLFDGLFHLEKLVPIWPPLWEQKVHLEKWEIEQDLDYISREITCTSRPAIQLSVPQADGWVAKRYMVLLLKL